MTESVYNVLYDKPRKISGAFLIISLQPVNQFLLNLITMTISYILTHYIPLFDDKLIFFNFIG